MARTKVVQIRCDRCGRMEFQPAKDDAASHAGLPAFEARLGDRVLKYDDICEVCKGAILQVWDNDLVEWKRPVKHARFTAPGPALPQDRAAPPSAPPDFTPPKPHSTNKK